MKVFKKSLIKITVLFFAGLTLSFLTHSYSTMIGELMRNLKNPVTFDNLKAYPEIRTVIYFGFLLIICWLTYLTKIVTSFLRWMYED